MKTINRRLAINGGDPVIPNGFVHPEWPILDDEYEDVVLKQMRKTISIYNRADIFEEFEDRFAMMHGKKYALLCNSGTNAIWAMFVGANLQPGDEVICPTYTFFATNTPLLSSGLKPVFSDALPDGNIDPSDIEKKITSKTKAIIVTHMWGYPCDMKAIAHIAKSHNLWLFEDCSHAHLAKIDGKYVGTFGDAAAWSLQGQKNITGGEGGILVTDNTDLYVRSNLHGHYNKRCKDEIPETHPLREFAVTGMGLKMRAHPLAVAIANLMLDKHPQYQGMRGHCASQYLDLLEQYDFIELIDSGINEPSWYAYIFKLKQTHIHLRQEIVDKLHAEGLTEVDIPGSTGPNHRLPIFAKPGVLFPQFYDPNEGFSVDVDFPGADQFHCSIIKLPTWTRKEHRQVLALYLDGLKKVLDKY